MKRTIPKAQHQTVHASRFGQNKHISVGQISTKKVHSVIKFYQEAWLKPYINMNTTITEAKNDFKKDFFKLMNNLIFGKTLENVRNHRDIKIVTTNK